VGKFRRGSNPTWLVIDESTPSTRNDIVFALFRQKIESMQHDLSRYAGKFNKTANFWVMIGDSRDMSLKHDVIDVVVTSPPYCTRIDYVVSTKPELLLLDHSEGEIDNLRRGNIGAPVIVNKDLGNQPVWGELCNAFLQGVANHASKASRSYYLPIYQQYFYDAERSLREIRRTLKKGGRAAIVVQSSYYKELELPLGDIYVQIASNLDLYAEIGRREVVRQHMAHINTKSSEYVKNKVYYEDVVYVEK
jgi:tRNA G10  N-methylase Trm11